MPANGGNTKGAMTASYEIAGGDFDRAGDASDALKRTLKRLGVKPEIIRRSVIAAYEAEMNVVIHARKGRMQVALDPRRLDVTVTDEGPGIPDIPTAMLEGFSTASDYARQLGFGAGTGLPNIRKCSDRLAVESEVGRSTTLRFRILLEPVSAVGEGRSSLRIRPARCTKCLRCVSACPTAALRVRNGTPVLLPHLCTDCAECIAVCGAGALSLECDEPFPDAGRDTVLVMNAACALQFGPAFSAGKMEAALLSRGFRDIRYLEEWEESLLAAVAQEAKRKGRPGPLIAPVCPAALNLIAVKFPALLPFVAPYLSPIEAAAKELADARVVFAVACPAQATAVASGQSEGRHRTGSAKTLNRYTQAVAEAGRRSFSGSPADGSGASGPEETLRVSGIRHVMRVFEQVENGLLSDFAVLAPYACDLGCFGSPLMIADAFAAQHRALRPHRTSGSAGRAIERSEPLRPRPGLRLDPDMGQAIEKLARMDALRRRLPGRDCGMCGAPTCEMLAEDIVLNRAGVSACPYQPDLKEDPL